jgi:hypothetical protein
MKKGLLFMFALLQFANISFSQQYEWAKSIGGTFDDIGQSIAVDDSGNVYIAGRYYGTVDFDPGLAGISNLTSTGSDAFIAKYDRFGNYIWAKNINSNCSSECRSIALDYLGNVYVTGWFCGTADFDPDLFGTALLNSVYPDIFIAKYDINGNYVWANNLKSTYESRGTSITVDHLCNVYVTGYFNDTIDIDPSNSNTLNFISTNTTSTSFAEDFFFAKYNTNGDYIWAKQIGDINNDFCSRIAVDESENVYITGYFGGIVDFDPSISNTANLICYGNPTNQESNGACDIFFAKYDINGNYIFAKNIECTTTGYGLDIAIDKLKNIYITGYLYDTGDFDPSPTQTAYLNSNTFCDIFFAKYNANGDYQWAKNMGSADPDIGFSITVDSKGNVYITGGYTNTADFNSDFSITDNLVSVGNYDIYFAKYDTDGNYIWAKSIGSIGNDFGNDITVDNFDNIIITGQFYNTADFNPDLSATANLVSAGAYDIFIAKYNQNLTNYSELAEIENLNIYPNPAVNNITISSNNANYKIEEINIYNILGEIVQSEKLEEHHQIVDINKLNNGIYMVEIKSGEKKKKQKLLIQR